MEIAPLFEEAYCKLTGDELIIKTFYFPTGQNKNINVKLIKGVYFEQQQMWKHCGKGWGMSFSPCWWGCDIRRGWHAKGDGTFYNVVIDCGEKTYKGFTVMDINSFVNEIRKVIHPEAVVAGNFPF